MKRSEVPAEQTWDLGLIYKSQEDAWKEADKQTAAAEQLEHDYKGKLNDAKSIVDCLHRYEEMSAAADRFCIYFPLTGRQIIQTRMLFQTRTKPKA